jgi:hypothetical protein
MQLHTLTPLVATLLRTYEAITKSIGVAAILRISSSILLVHSVMLALLRRAIPRSELHAVHPHDFATDRDACNEQGKADLDRGQGRDWHWDRKPA